MTSLLQVQSPLKQFRIGVAKSAQKGDKNSAFWKKKSRFSFLFIFVAQLQ